jgi:hypothetical protein
MEQDQGVAYEQKQTEQKERKERYNTLCGPAREDHREPGS